MTGEQDQRDETAEAVRRPITMQINTYPLDLPHFRHTLEHKMRAFGGQVDRTIVTVDVRPPQSGRYKGDPKAERYTKSLEAFRALYSELEARYRNLKFLEVDYSPETKSAVSNLFMGREGMPDKAWDGGPFYCYFQGIHSAGDGYVLHMDADMLYGGLSQTWVLEAVDLLQRREDLLTVGPLAGPTHPDGLKGAHTEAFHAYDKEIIDGRTAYRFHFISTRIFLIDMQRFKSHVGSLVINKPPFYRRLSGALLGNPTDVRSAEMVLSETIQAKDLGNMHFLGSGEGMYSLHPPHHTPAFHQALPDLIARVERGEIPDAQLGDYDINDSMFDFSEARRQHAKVKRLKRRLRDVVTYWTARLTG